MGSGAPQAEAGAEPPEARPAPALGNENHTIVKVYYATDRQRTSSKQLASIYSGQPADPIRISYGICEVSIPKGHKPGQLEAPSIYRFEFKEDPDKHVVLLNIHPQEKKILFPQSEGCHRAIKRRKCLHLHSWLQCHLFGRGPPHGPDFL